MSKKPSRKRPEPSDPDAMVARFLHNLEQIEAAADVWIDEQIAKDNGRILDMLIQELTAKGESRRDFVRAMADEPECLDTVCGFAALYVLKNIAGRVAKKQERSSGEEST